MSAQQSKAEGMPGGTAVAAGDWTIDPDRSKVGFTTRAMGGLFPVKASFARFHGSLVIDADGVARGAVVIDPASIATKIGKRDAHLRSEDFFYVEKYPEMEFILEAVKLDGAQPVATGVLHIRDKKVQISTPVTLEGRGDELLAEAEFVVDHDAAGLGWSKPVMVQKTIKAHVSLTLVQTPSP